MHLVSSSSLGANEDARPLLSSTRSGLHSSLINVRGRRYSYGALEQKKGPMVLVIRCARGRKIPNDRRLPPIDHVQTLLSVLTLEDTNHYASLEYHSKSMEVVDWFTLFEELSKRENWLLILEIFRWMQQQRWYKPDDGFYSKIISILGKKGQLRLAASLFGEMKKHGCRPDSSVFNALINAHMRNNNNKDMALVKALSYYEQMKNTTHCKPNLVTYNTLLRACAQAKQHEKLEELFKEMELEGFKPDIYTFNGVLDAHGKAGDFAAMESLLKKMRHCKVKADFITYNTMIDAYGKAGNIEKMEEALKNMALAKVKPQLSTLNSLVNNYGAAKCVNQMEMVLKTMSELGVRPTLITYEVLMKGYGNAKRFDKMQTCLEGMCEVGIRPEITTLNAVMEAYSNHGLFKEAEGLLDNAAVAPTTLTYRILYQGYLKHGRTDKVDALLKMMDTAGIMPDDKFLMHSLEFATNESKSSPSMADPREPKSTTSKAEPHKSKSTTSKTDPRKPKSRISRDTGKWSSRDSIKTVTPMQDSTKTVLLHASKK